ncbi:MAG: hypothetical protein PH343_03385, partial [Nitrospira sp.]|nr:hypothetical protein [Nitrospira sp.]
MERIMLKKDRTVIFIGAILVSIMMVFLSASLSFADGKSNDEHGTEGIVPIPTPPHTLNEHCTVSVLNRTAQVKPDGTWVIPNVPSNMGKVRVRATCVENGITRSGQSDWVTIPANGSITVSDIPLDVFDPAPSSVNISSPSATLTTLVPAVQLTVTATYPGGTTRDITQGSTGTVYGTTNPAIAAVSDNGLVTATGTGKVIISASNDMVLSSLMFTVTQTGNNNDVDNDGIPDDWELANGLNPNDPIDALRDFDHD